MDQFIKKNICHKSLSGRHRAISEQYDTTTRDARTIKEQGGGGSQRAPLLIVDIVTFFGVTACIFWCSRSSDIFVAFLHVEFSN